LGDHVWLSQQEEFPSLEITDQIFRNIGTSFYFAERADDLEFVLDFARVFPHFEESEKFGWMRRDIPEVSSFQRVRCFS
jgi:hypothetical protein